MDVASGTTLNKLKERAELNAFRRLQSQFSSPEQLEQIDQHIIRNEKRKVAFKNDFVKNYSYSNVYISMKGHC